MLVTFGIVLLASLCYAGPSRIPNVTPDYLDKLRADGANEEFARLLGIDDVNFVVPSDERSDEIIFTTVSSLGDILLTPEQSRQALNFAMYTGNKWPNNCIYYCISKTDFASASDRKAIEAALSVVNTTNLKYINRCNETDYIMVINGKGCYSNLGRTGGQQALSLQNPGCLSNGTIQHEFMHAAGLIHEHNRPDRDDHIKVMNENIPEDWRSQYEKMSPNQINTMGPYDLYSVMHYPVNAPSTSKPAYQVLNNSTVQMNKIGQRTAPSTIDMQKIAKMYPK